MRAEFEAVRRWLAEAERVAVLTGAGISHESGVPVFRGQDGLWRQYRPEDLATPQAFARDPRLVWEWYNWRRSVVARAQPNPGHRALVELEERTRDFTLVTQNVDGLHERAGSRRLLKLHGDLWTLRCLDCGRESVDRAVPLPELPPRCACGGLLRPGVVWFGEPLPEEVLRQALEAAGRAQVFLVVGTSAVVQPAASLPLLARRAGARVVELNLEETPLTGQVDASFLGKSGELLPRLVEAAVRS
ncbi:MAG: NAD-dependent deacylase [Acidobacteria bacterium]|nr:NAD-dependent deacylase [Acidobacteriota bacterium]